ncbi:DEAD/DEAH box helicase, partial [Demequina lutea]
MSTASFADLGLPEKLVATLAHYELTVPFPIQSATIADALAGRDVLGKARTGSGKTLAFGLPILARVADLPKPERHQVHALVLVPTRELAMQVGDALEPYAHATQLTYRLVAGGLSMSKQIMAVERGVHLVVATPGRLADLVRRGHIDLSHTSITVLDEADHMAEMGFGEEIAEILDKTPADAQRLLFSATLDGVVDDLVKRYMHNPVLHDVTDGSAQPTQRHVMISIPPHEKYKMATRMAAREGRTLCFVRTKLAADRIAADMRANGVPAAALHGDRSQAERNFVMVEFRSGRLPVLVATDVAARGIHVDAVDLVIQIDPPADHRDYTHRSGRTGRAGADGLAVMLVLPHQRNAALRVLDEANIQAEDAAFRTVDAAALAKIDALTGARQPSGVPVIEPLPVMRADRRGGRDRGGNDSRGGRDRPGRERPSRGRPVTSPRDDAAFAAKRDHLTAKERELADRERALALREQQLSGQTAAPPATPARTERPARREYTERPEQTERPQRG